MQDDRITSFLERLESIDGHQALSDAKLRELHRPNSMVVLEEGDEVVAVGVIADHKHFDGSSHCAIETAVTPGLRFQEFESAVLEASLGLVPRGRDVTVWSRRHSLDIALERAGFTAFRELAHYVVALPLEKPTDQHTVRTFRSGDTDAILRVNRLAFAEHREAAVLDEDGFSELVGQSWFDPEGLIVAQDGSEIVGFCWTRVHHNGDGEIYRIGVAPEAQGRGLGEALVRRGFAHLSNDPEVTRGTLWVDVSNVAAIRLYESIGMARATENREFSRGSGQPKR